MNTMKNPTLLFAVFFLVLASLAGCEKEEDALSHDEIIRADLAEIIELQGMSCGDVVKFETDRRLDYRVECGSGDQYRVHVSAEGHIKIEPQQE